MSLPIHWSIYEYSPKSLDISRLICYHTISYRNSKSKLGFLFKVINARQPRAWWSRLPDRASREDFSCDLTLLWPAWPHSAAAMGFASTPALATGCSALLQSHGCREISEEMGTCTFCLLWEGRGGSTGRRLEACPACTLKTFNHCLNGGCKLVSAADEAKEEVPLITHDERRWEGPWCGVKDRGRHDAVTSVSNPWQQHACLSA